MSGAWPFELNNIHTYAFANDVFSPEECKKIVEIGKKLEKKRGTAGDRDDDYRLSNVAWIYPSDETNWIFLRLAQVATSLNSQFFNFDLFGLIEGLQFTEYVGEEHGKYDKHTDTMFGGYVRKLSMTVQLSDESSYEGGEVVLYANGEGYVNTKEQGRLLIFPSFTLHEVKPVTKGTRYSLVAWVTGKSFR